MTKPTQNLHIQIVVCAFFQIVAKEKKVEFCEMVLIFENMSNWAENILRLTNIFSKQTHQGASFVNNECILLKSVGSDFMQV